MFTILFALTIGVLATSAQESKELTGTFKMEVKGLSCPFCAYGLEKNLMEIPNIDKINIDIEGAFVTLMIKEGKTVSIAELKKKVKVAGFTPGDIKTLEDE